MNFSSQSNLRSRPSRSESPKQRSRHSASYNMPLSPSNNNIADIKQMNGKQSRTHTTPLINKLKLKIEHILTNIQKLHTQSIQTSSNYSYLYQKFKPILLQLYKLCHFILLELLSIINDIIFKTTYLHKLYILLIIILYYSSYYYYIKVPII